MKPVQEIRRLRESLRRITVIHPAGEGWEKDALANAREEASSALNDAPRLSEFEGYYPVEEARRLERIAETEMGLRNRIEVARRYLDEGKIDRARDALSLDGE